MKKFPVIVIASILLAGCSNHIPTQQPESIDGYPRGLEESAQDSTDNHDIGNWNTNDTVEYIVTPSASDWEDPDNVDFDFGW